MGSNKLMLPFKNKPLLRHVAEAVLKSQAEPVIVVTGHQRQEVLSAIDGLEFQDVFNPGFAEGLAGSLKAGIAALGENVDGALILLGDMPLVDAPLIDLLVSARRARPDAAAIVPTSGGRRGNPVLIGRSLFAAVAKLGGDHGARALLASCAETIIEVPVPGNAVILDVDTPEAFQALTSASVISAK